MDRINVGVIHLPLPQTLSESPSVLASTSANPWSPLTPDLLTCLAAESELSTVLVNLLLDSGIRFGAQCQVVKDELVVRCSLVPSDGQGSDWKQKARLDRSKLLKKLFYELRTGWDGGGDWVMETQVSLPRRLMNSGWDELTLQDEDRYRIHDLYARIPSPVTPSTEDWIPLSLGDVDTQSRLISQGDLAGLETSLYRYQNVSHGSIFR